MTGTHIELFLVDGTPGGLTTAEVAGWTGHVLSGPRSELSEILRRPESSRNGVYFLLGDDPNAIGDTRAYIGRTENFAQRVRNHDTKKDFWDRVVLMSSKDDAYNEGHWAYLEHRLMEITKRSERVSLDNDQTAQTRKLSEAQRSDMESFLTQLGVVLPVMGVNALKSRSTPSTLHGRESDQSPIFSLKNEKHGVDAKAQVVDDEFILLEGSRIVATWRGKATSATTKRTYASLVAEFEKLLANGSLVAEGETALVVRDIPFSSPSRAAAIALGRSSNGRNEWLWENRRYADWEMRGVEEALRSEAND